MNRNDKGDQFRGVKLTVARRLIIAAMLVCVVAANLLEPLRAVAAVKQYRQALPGYKFVFPRDHASHDDFKTEWWYYTGHLETKDKRRFGYELTFFRSGVEEPVSSKSPWTLKNVYLAHFAVSDLTNKKFYFFEKLNRSALKLAGASEQNLHVYNETWSIEQLGQQYVLRADSPSVSLHLLLSSLKPPVVHGKDGVSQKASCVGCASHYYSMTRLQSEGWIEDAGKISELKGTSWMDHEFGSNQLTDNQVGWDWYSIQLDDNTELMLYTLRDEKGKVDPNSSGTIVYSDGKSVHLAQSEFQVDSDRFWSSAATKAKYPMRWHVRVPSRKLDISIEPEFENQELVTKNSTGVAYWEGACSVNGNSGGHQVHGQAYVEMTGYAEKFRKKI